MQERGQVKGSLDRLGPHRFPELGLSVTGELSIFCSSSWGLWSPTLINPSPAPGVFRVATNLKGSLSTCLKPGSSLSPPQHP